MIIKEYPFIKTSPTDFARPYLPITIVNPINNKDLNVYALIDTGAYDCVFPASFAKPLGLNLKHGDACVITTGNGIAHAFRHTVRILTYGYSTGPHMVDFFPHLNVPILGVRSFLNNLILTINYPAKSFSIQIPEPK